jgi:predicted ferric reductase
VAAVKRPGAGSTRRYFAFARKCASLNVAQPLRATRIRDKEGAMLWTIAVILLVLWALGLVTSYTAGGLVHVLLVIAVIVVVFQFIGGRRSI